MCAERSSKGGRAGQAHGLGEWQAAGDNPWLGPTGRHYLTLVSVRACCVLRCYNSAYPTSLGRAFLAFCPLLCFTLNRATLLQQQHTKWTRANRMCTFLGYHVQPAGWQARMDADQQDLAGSPAGKWVGRDEEAATQHQASAQPPHACIHPVARHLIEERIRQAGSCPNLLIWEPARHVGQGMRGACCLATHWSCCSMKVEAAAFPTISPCAPWVSSLHTANGSSLRPGQDS